MNQSNPINPAVLKWARITSGLSVEQVAAKLNRKKITSETILAWESGEVMPSYQQLERLAYEVYKRPLAIFLFPHPPAEETPQQAFRTLPDSEIQRLSTRLLVLIRQAKAMQINLEELYDGDNPAEKQLVRDLPFDLDRPEADLARQVRKFLGVELSEQLVWRDTERAFKEWRTALESHGVFVFKDAFKDDLVSGFCLYDARFPLIYVNNSRPFSHQIFTLFHELAHLLSGTGGIDTLNDAYIDSLAGQDRKVEVLCNKFASAFLVPEMDFDKRIARMPISESSISDLANVYSVSREVILRRLLDKHLVTQQYYDSLVKQWRNTIQVKHGSGGNYYLTKRAYLGENYLELVFSRLYQNRITTDQLADYLGVKISKVPGMEALLFPGRTAA